MSVTEQVMGLARKARPFRNSRFGRRLLALFITSRKINPGVIVINIGVVRGNLRRPLKRIESLGIGVLCQIYLTHAL